MSEKPDDICPRPEHVPPQPTQPHTPPIYLSSVYECRDPAQADAMLGGQLPGHVYARESHPNGDLLAEKCRQLHGSERAIITSSGMAALAAALLSQLQTGDHIVLSNQLYGRTLHLVTSEAPRLGITHTIVDTADLKATEAAFTPKTRLLMIETITNPLLWVSDIKALAEIAHRHQAQLLVDNTFAGPVICRPIEWGADLVMESLTKTMNGHADVLLGLLCGPERSWGRMKNAVSCWGLAPSPFDCWLAMRGVGTLALRIERAAANALAVAQYLKQQKSVATVHYPGLAEHPQHALAERQFGGAADPRYGAMVTFTLRGDRPAAEAFIAAAKRIPFCPSLGELSTTLSHPETTSHRGLTPESRAALGVTGGTIRLSIGIESPESVIEFVAEGLAAVRS